MHELLLQNDTWSINGYSLGKEIDVIIVMQSEVLRPCSTFSVKCVNGYQAAMRQVDFHLYP